MDQAAKLQHIRSGWARKAPPKVSFEQCHSPTGCSVSPSYSPHEISSPLPTSGLQMKPSVKTTRPRKSLVELSYAQRNILDTPMSPLASKTSPKGSLASPNTEVQRRPFRIFSQTRMSNQAEKSTPVKISPAKAGNKKAILISVSYANTGGARKLESCANLSLLYDLLILHLGFTKENVWVLTDEPRAVPGAATFFPTRANIVNGMRWLVRNSGKGDQLMFSFSGHGCRIESEDTQAPFDDCILPSDHPSSRPITEREITDILVQTLDARATLTTLFDCRNSALVMKLPYVHVVAKGAKGSFTMQEELELPGADSTRDVVLNSVLRFSRIKKGNIDSRKKVAEERRNSVALSCFDNGTVICISARAEPKPESSAFGSTATNHGALTSAFVSYMRYSATQKKKASYSSVLCAMSTWLLSKGEDRLPQFSSTHNVSPDMVVTLL